MRKYKPEIPRGIKLNGNSAAINVPRIRMYFLRYKVEILMTVTWRQSLWRLHEEVSQGCPEHAMENLMGVLLIPNWSRRLLQFQAFRYTEKYGDR